MFGRQGEHQRVDLVEEPVEGRVCGRAVGHRQLGGGFLPPRPDRCELDIRMGHQRRDVEQARPWPGPDHAHS